MAAYAEGGFSRARVHNDVSHLLTGVLPKWIYIGDARILGFSTTRYAAPTELATLVTGPRKVDRYQS